MKLGLVLPIYNRPDQLRECLKSVSESLFPSGTVLILINDGSTDPETENLWKGFNLEGVQIIRLIQPNKGIRDTLQIGWDMCIAMGCDVLTNLDSDAIVKPDVWERLLDLHTSYPQDLITGFNCDTKNKDGNERHKKLKECDGITFRASVGGINMMFSVETYEKHVKPALNKVGNWDHNSCLSIGRAISLVPSAVQHLPGVSSLGHNEPPDIAEDFFNLSLPDVTLIGVDNNAERLKIAADYCTRDIQFGKVVLLNPNITSKEQYSEFMIRELYKHFETSHCLIIQHDGYVLNWKAWRDEWLTFDYIGATWGYKDGMNVGNGGFSLRSRKIMQEVCNNRVGIHPEDHFICRIARKELIEKGIKFAPAEEADKFSIEAHGMETAFKGANKYSGQFGFHGYNVDFSGSGLSHIPVKPIPKQAAPYGARQRSTNTVVHVAPTPRSRW